MTTILIIGIIAWMASGTGSFIYWWTKDYDLEEETYLLLFLTALIGPFAFLGGYLIHGRKGFYYKK